MVERSAEYCLERSLRLGDRRLRPGRMEKVNEEERNRHTERLDDSSSLSV